MQGADVRVAEKPEELAVKVTMTYPNTDGGGLTYETYFGQDAEAKTINLLLDKLTDAAKRQRIKSDLERERVFLYNDRCDKERMEHGLQVMDLMAAEKASMWDESGKRGTYKTPEGEVASRKGIVANIDIMRQKIEQRAEKIEALQRELSSTV